MGGIGCKQWVELDVKMGGTGCKQWEELNVNYGRNWM